ncbi:putative serine/threonine-protein kinase-like protein CCR3 [Cornus florida]|uniref:putative serine/threonine-protein kinase-like protein CCR3 n=1 Tax=Cornus florida TaxID=4283 RepID=UPI00289856B9|nr:putative serine/threonine-protein kinase-like protein CCR3 [Cornus florida]
MFHMKTPFSSYPTIAIAIIILIAAGSPPPSVTGLGCSSTIAVSYGRNSTTVCGIISGEPIQTIQCYNAGKTFSIEPNISYESISGGRDLLCGLISGGLSLLCWDTATFQPKRIYHSTHRRLTELTVGDTQICAIEAITSLALCWRFPSPEVASKFSTITSGGGFSCGIVTNNSRVICWGGSKIGAEIQRQFGNFTMLSLVAGESHACGVTKSGTLICKGRNNNGQLDVPSHSAFEYSGVALGVNQSCAILRKNGVVICWGGGLKRSEFARDFWRYGSFESIVAGMDFICGLKTTSLSLFCWGLGWSNGFSLGTVVPLPMVIPGPCVQASCSMCGVYPDSDGLCAGSGRICKSCEVELPIPALLPPMSPSAQPVFPPSKGRKRMFLVFGIVGCVGSFAGICTAVYCLWGVVCGFLQPKVHNAAQPTVARANAGTASMSSNRFDAPPSRSASVKRDRSLKLSRQRSGTSSRHMEKADKFSLSDLAAATNNFSLENKIGGGSFGTVYKGKLADGREVAIKRGEIGVKTEKFREKEIAFDSELLLLSRLHHKHLVELLGFCQEKDERLLVYEYMSNGSLHDHLHSKNNVQISSSILNSWKMRIKIALDAARGVEYLHNYAVPPIIHRDIKSSNILLGANWTAKVSDFGLSLKGPESDQETMSSKAVGTVGYIDPEYYVLNILTVKSDVYGLGVVLLELLTGKRAVFKDDGSGPMGVVEYAVPRISTGELQSVLDERIGPPAMNEIEAVELVAYTAMHCVNLEGKERPTMSDIVANLERALDLCEDSHGSISGNNTFPIATQ